ncbi:MAG: 30S ribosomal protein S4 [Polyangiales bacterium]
MSRYTGPRVKIMRTLGLDLPGLSPKTSERRPYPAGQHGQRRRKETEFGKRLKEKQKLRLNYGLSEAQMRNTFREALSSRTNTGTKLVELLERRLDNVVFRAGFARSIPAARQLVNHGHVLVNGRRVDIPSFRVKVGQKISLKESSHQSQAVVQGLEFSDKRAWENGWLNIDRDARAVSISALPDESATPFRIDVQLVVEFYALSA